LRDQLELVGTTAVIPAVVMAGLGSELGRAAARVPVVWRYLFAAGLLGVATVVQALDTPPAAAGLSAALAHVAAHEPQLMMSLRDDILPMLNRRPIGEQLRDLMPDID
jgi:hypothetical protein